MKRPNPYLSASSSSTTPSLPTSSNHQSQYQQQQRQERTNPYLTTRPSEDLRRTHVRDLVFCTPGELSERAAVWERGRARQGSKFSAAGRGARHDDRNGGLRKPTFSAARDLAAATPEMTNGSGERRVPSMEWWDVAFLPKEAREAQLQADKLGTLTPLEAPYDLLRLSNQKGSVYVEHPVPLEPTAAAIESDAPLKVYQTKAETKRMRRQAREVRNRETRDKIAVGLLAPPPPKVRFSNLLRVLGERHVADPTEVEAQVRAEVEARLRLSEAHNEARKLTPAERRAKRQRRIQADARNGTKVVVFRVTNLRSPTDLAEKRRALISSTAKKLAVTGLIVVVNHTTTPSIVVAEGGPRGVRRFAKLMLRSIDWRAKTLMESLAGSAALEGARRRDGGDDSGSSDDESDEPPDDGDEATSTSASTGGGQCHLVWQGETSGRVFDGPFKIEVVDSGLDVRALLDSLGVAYYWDAVTAFDPSVAGYDASEALRRLG